MEIKVVEEWISKRLSSRTYKDFILAELFYNGKIPKIFYDEGVDIYDEDTILSFDDSDLLNMSYNSLKRPIAKKVNYLLAKPYSVEGSREVKKYLQDIVDTLKKTVSEIYKKGEVWWEYEPDNTSDLRFKITVRTAESIVPHYTNEECTEYDAVGYLWNRIDDYGKVNRYVDLVDSQGRHRFPVSGTQDSVEDLGHAKTSGGRNILFRRLPFIKLEGDNLYLLIRYLGKMYSDRYVQTDSLLKDNCDPIAVIKNASETDVDIFNEDLRRSRTVRVEGTGDFSYASKSVDYSPLESYLKMIKSDIFDQLGVVSRETELSYVTSGRAIDRLYVDMDNDAADMGQILRNGVKDFLSFVQEQTGKDYTSNFDIIFNTDKPTDEQQIIANISSSQFLLSKRTLLEQHPWVKDVDEELKRIEEESSSNRTPVIQDVTIQDQVITDGFPQIDEEIEEDIQS